MKAITNFLTFVVAGWPTRMLAALALTGLGGVFYVVALISVIGVPFALALLALPAAAALYVASESAHQLSRVASPGRPLSRRTAAIVIVVAAVAAAQVANFRLGATARALAAADFDQSGGASITTLAISIDQLRDDARFPNCDSLCLALLIGGAVDAVLLTGPVDPATGPAPTAPAVAARFERRGECERRYYFPQTPPRLVGKKNAAAREYAAYAEARRRQDSGFCLVETPARLGAADAVLAEMTVKKGASAAKAGFDLFADTTSATRVSLYRRTGGAFAERRRRTVVRYLPLLWAAAPTYINTTGLNVRVGFARVPAYLNAKGPRSARAAKADFLADQPGLDFAPAGG